MRVARHMRREQQPVSAYRSVLADVGGHDGSRTRRTGVISLGREPSGSGERAAPPRSGHLQQARPDAVAREPSRPDVAAQRPRGDVGVLRRYPTRRPPRPGLLQQARGPDGRGRPGRGRPGYFQQSLDIRAGLAQAEPDRADYQRDLSVSYNKLGDLMVAVGRGEDALRYFQQSLDIGAGLAQAEPDRADYQRDLSVSYNKLGDLMVAVGRGEDALRYFQQSLDIAARLAQAEPDRADYQRDLSVSYERLAGQARETDPRTATTLVAKAVQIREGLREREPNRVDLAEELAATLIQQIGITEEIGDRTAQIRAVLQPFAIENRVTEKGRKIIALIEQLDMPEG